LTRLDSTRSQLHFGRLPVVDLFFAECSSNADPAELARYITTVVPGMGRATGGRRNLDAITSGNETALRAWPK
jgi:hypothetical protein